MPVSPYLTLILLVGTVWAFRHRTTRLWRWRYALLAAFVWSDVLTTPTIGNYVIGNLESSYRPPSTPVSSSDPLIVVLSTGSIFKDGDRHRVELDASGWERLHEGVELWRRIGGALLFVGGPSPDGAASVAAHMAAAAHSWGVPSAAIQAEEKSQTTYENLLFTRDLVAAHRGDAWLVTSALHMRRAMAVAHKLDLPFRPYPCDYKWRPILHWYAWLPNAGGAQKFMDALHEIVGLALYRLRGRAA